MIISGKNHVLDKNKDNKESVKKQLQQLRFPESGVYSAKCNNCKKFHVQYHGDKVYSIKMIKWEMMQLLK